MNTSLNWHAFILALDRGEKFVRGVEKARLCGEKILPEGVEIFWFNPGGHGLADRRGITLLSKKPKRKLWFAFEKEPKQIGETNLVLMEKPVPIADINLQLFL